MPKLMQFDNDAIGVHRHVGMRLWVSLLTLSAFGPYVIGHIDTGQLLGCISALGILIFGWPFMLRRNGAPLLPLAIIWSGLYVIILLATIWPPSNLGGYTQLPILNALGAYALPLALLLTTWFWTLIMEVRDLIVTISKSIVACMTCNAALSVCELATRRVNGFYVINALWSVPNAPGSAAAVGLRASENGRYIGIFYQPAIAGTLYGIALFCSLFLIQTQPRSSGRRLALCASTLCLGGIITVSKVFLLGALPIAGLLILQDRNRRRPTLAWLVAFGLALWILGIANILPSWNNGTALLEGFVSPQGSVIRTFTAGRYGSGSTLGTLSNNVLHLSPWIGFGAGGLNVAYDSMWTETLAVSGLFGVVILGFAMILLFTKWMRLNMFLPEPDWRLAGATLTLALGGSLGIPTFTGQRVSTILWLVLGVLLITGSSSVKEYRDCILPAPVD